MAQKHEGDIGKQDKPKWRKNERSIELREDENHKKKLSFWKIQTKSQRCSIPLLREDNIIIPQHVIVHVNGKWLWETYIKHLVCIMGPFNFIHLHHYSFFIYDIKQNPLSNHQIISFSSISNCFLAILKIRTLFN